MFLAQTEAATPATIIGAFILVTVSLVTLIGWLIRHLFITTLPGIAKDAEDQRECHEANLAKICETFSAESAAERKLCEEKFTLVNAQLAAMNLLMNQERAAVVSSINQHTTEAMAAYRHDLNDKISEAVLGRDLFLMQKARREQLEKEQNESHPSK